MNVDHIEVMGRDKSVVSTHPSSTKATVRSIIDSDVALPDTTQLKFDIKPNKIFLFNFNTERRLGLEEPNDNQEEMKEENNQEEIKDEKITMEEE